MRLRHGFVDAALSCTCRGETYFDTKRCVRLDNLNSPNPQPWITKCIRCLIKESPEMTFSNIVFVLLPITIAYGTQVADPPAAHSPVILSAVNDRQTGRTAFS